MTSVENSINKKNDVIIKHSNYFNTISDTDNLNKYIFDLYLVLYKTMGDNLTINIEIPSENNTIEKYNINTKTHYITYFNKHTIKDVKKQLCKIIEDNQFIENMLNKFEQNIKNKKHDSIFILFAAQSLNQNIKYIPFLVDNNNINFVIKIKDYEIFNTKNY
tara:strand:+ start:2982 stop:3467 length:486 start_codon:yes stop_codon:yes gene_type:complete